MFGLLAIFLTINPDDLRNYRIVVYALVGKERTFGSVNEKDLSEGDIVADFKIRKDARLNHPGLCAEDYECIVALVIKHLFNWDIDKQKSNGAGLFAEILAFCLATEEQGRKSLHSHFLLFVKNWKMILDLLQRRSKEQNHSENQLSFKQATKQSKKLFTNACSANLFSDFATDGILAEVPVFSHNNCRSKRRREQMQFSVLPVCD